MKITFWGAAETVTGSCYWALPTCTKKTPGTTTNNEPAADGLRQFLRDDLVWHTHVATHSETIALN